MAEESEMEKLTREENLADLEIYIGELNTKIRACSDVFGVLMSADTVGDCIDRILLQVKYVLTHYMERQLKQDIPGIDPDYYSEQVHRLNQARDALVRAKDAGDIHETT